jgi:hypothetical protein
MTTQTDVAQLYTAFFDRAPDAAGLAYWVGQVNTGAINLAQMASNWVTEQPEGQTRYPAGTSDAAFIAAIYNNVLGRLADNDGAQYWQNQLASGAVSRDVFIAAIINGAHSNTSAQGLLDAKLLDNKAAAGIAFADHGSNNTALATKVLTTVTSSDASLIGTLSLIKMIPADANLTPALVASFSSTMDKVAALIASEPGEQGDLATYLSTVSAGVTSSTNLDQLLSTIRTLATSALTDSSALDNPAALGQADIAAANPPVDGGGGTPTDPTGPTDPVVTLTATSANGVLKIAGTSADDVTVDMTAHTVKSGVATVAITGDATFTGVDATGYGGAVTAVGTVKEIVSGNPTYTNVAHLQVVDNSFEILTWAKYYLGGVDKISLVGNAAGTITADGYTELGTLTGNHGWSYDIRDSVNEIIFAANNSEALTNATKVVVADTFVNLQSDAGQAAIAGHTGYIVRDTFAHISGATGDEATFLSGAITSIIHDSVAGIQDALTAGAISITGSAEYEVEDTATALLAINSTDPTFLKHPSSVTVTGDDAGTLNLAQRDALGKVTDDDFWAYKISDDATNIVANAQGDHSDYLLHATDVTVTGSVSLAQVGAIAAVPTLDASGWHFSIVDSVANTPGYNIGNFAITATASEAADTLDGNISTGAVTMSFGLNDAATFTFADTGFSSTGSVDVFNNFVGSTDKIDLTAFQLTGQDIVTAQAVGNHAITDGHFALVTGVALVNGVYTASQASDAGTLVIWDADTAAGVIKQVGVFVAEANVDVSALVTGAVPT